MDLCPNCGRQRTGGNRFCGGCGAALPEPSPDVTRVDVPSEVTRTDTPATAKPAQPADDPFASWFAPDAAGQPGQPGQHGPGQQGPGGGSGWQPTETLYAAPGGQAGSYPQAANYPPAGGYPPPSQGGPVYPQAFGPTRSRGRGVAFFLVSLVVVLAAGGGAYALVSMSGKNHSSQPAAAGSTPAGSTARASATSPTSPASPTEGSTTSPASTATATAPAGGVAVGSGVASGPNTTVALGLLDHYFHGINTHNYSEYSAVLDDGLRAGQPQSSFDSGYASTQDSGMTLTSVADAGGGELAATVTFTSHQDPKQSIDNSACNKWTLTLYLAKQSDGSYLMTHAPAGYHATYTDC